MTKQKTHNEEVVGQFTQQAEAYGDLVKSIPTDRTAALRAFAGITTDDVVLEVACGTGSLTVQLAPFVRHVTGIDLTPAMLERGQAEQAALSIDNIDWRNGDACALPFDDDSFSLVICQAAFHHLDEPKLAFAEMARVCTSGGRVVVIDVSPTADKSAAYDMVEKMRDPSHVHALPLEEVAILGNGLPVSKPQSSTRITADLPFDAVLATSFPDPPHTRETLSSLMRDDAVSGQDRLGFSARLIDEKLCVSYPMSTTVWTKLPSGRN